MKSLHSKKCSVRNKMLVEFLSIVAFVFLVCITACDRDKIYTEEQYKNVIYLLSGSGNVYTEGYTLNETEPVKYFSIGIGGSNPNTEEVIVTLEPDNVIMGQYNRNNFDDEDKYARLLPASRYDISSYTITIPAKPDEQYVKVPVKVRPLGLSPDTIYFIPLAIKSVTRYGVNPEKYNMLYRVTIENDYAQQKVNTYYTKRGTQINPATPHIENVLSGVKLVQPLTKNTVRMFVGNWDNQEMTVENIDKYAMVVQVNEDNTLDITPYATDNLEVERLDDLENYNFYYPKETQGDRDYRVFYLRYRYRILDSDGTYSAWMEARESLTRVEED